MIFLIIIVAAYLYCLFHYSFEIEERAEALLDRVMQQCLFLNRVNSNHIEHMKYSLKGTKYDIQYIGILDDDEDVYGHCYRLYFYIPALSKAKVGLINYMFYEDKPYKNRKEIILWQDKEELQELNFSDKLIKKLMMASVKKQLKKKLPASTNLTSH